MPLILEAVLSDAPDILRIFNESRKEMIYLPSLHTDKETTEFIYNLVKEGGVWIAKDDEVTVGFIHIKNGWVNHLYVLPGFQDKGIGKLLLDKVKNANQKGLNLWVFEQNTNAIRFYEREGFVLSVKRDKDNADNEENLPDRLYSWAPMQ